MLKKSILAGLALAMGLSLSGCHRTTATSAAIIGGAILGAAAYDHYYHTNYRSRYGYHRGYYYRDRGDCRWYRYGGRWNRGYCYGRRWNSADTVSSERTIAKTYLMSSSAAREFINAFQAVKNSGEFDALRKIGMSDGDIRKMARGETPSTESVGSIAQTVGAPRSSVRALMREITEEYRLQSENNWRVD